MAVGFKKTPIYLLDLPSAAWRLFWWMIFRMDGNKELNFGWKAQAERDLGIAHDWVIHCAQLLMEANLIYMEPRKRYARVLVSNIVGG